MTTAQPEALSVAAVDEQTIPIDTSRWVALATAVLRDEGVTGPAELALWFVDEEEIAVLNEQHMGEHGPTDVLSFPLDAFDDEPLATGMPLLLGDVFICPTVAARNAPDHPGTHAPLHRGTLDDELALLVVHGVLHILGFDHAEAADETSMQARERALLAAHHQSVAP
jgi:probable rRNA maturation factor